MAKYGLDDKQMDLTLDREYFDLQWASMMDYEQLVAGKTIDEASFNPCAYSASFTPYMDATIADMLAGLDVRFIIDLRVRADLFIKPEVKLRIAEQVIARGAIEAVIYYYETIKTLTAAEKQLIRPVIEAHPSYNKKLRVTAEEKEANRTAKREDRIAAREAERQAERDAEQAAAEEARQAARQAERQRYRAWLNANGYDAQNPPDEVPEAYYEYDGV